MRITVITCPFGELPPIAIGAVEKLFYLLAKEWVSLGNVVTFMCAGGGADDRIRFIRLKKYKRTGSTKKDLIWDLLYSIKALWRCPKTDILFCNTFWTPFLAPIFRWKYKKLIYGVHRYPKGQFFLYPFVHLFICVSTVVSDALRKELGGDERIIKINNPIDTAIFRLETIREGGDLLVAYAGRIHPEKGLDIAFEACERMAKVMPVGFKLLGTWALECGGGGESYLKHLTSLAPHVNLSFVGAITDPEEIARQLRECSVFIYPSIASRGETFGVAPLEAMALGLPTVLSDLACFADYAENAINCVQFHLGENAIDECEKAMRRIWHDSLLRKQLSQNAAKTAKGFSVRHIANKYLVAFENLMRTSSDNVMES